MRKLGWLILLLIVGTAQAVDELDVLASEEFTVPEQDTLVEFTLSQVRRNKCHLVWQYPRDKEHEIDGFRLFHDNGKAEIGHEIKKTARRHACKQLGIDEEGHHSVYMVSYKGEQESVPTETFQFRVIGPTIFLIPPEKFRVIIRR